VVIGKPFDPTLLTAVGKTETYVVPTGASELLFGVNADRPPNPYGSYDMSVTMNGVPGSSGGVSGGVPEAPSYLMALMGIFGIGAISMRKRAVA